MALPLMQVGRMASTALPKGVPRKQAGALIGGKIAGKLDPIHGSKVDAWISESDSALNLGKLVAKERGQGAGTAFMKDLAAEADKAGKRIDLSPSSDFGGNKKRLVDFYKRFGFVQNKGKTKDLEISESMYRLPSSAPKRPTNAQGQPIPPTQYELAHAEAQRVAALPVEQGGLGLPANNTAMDRARAMGHNTETLRGVKSNVATANESGTYSTNSPLAANMYAGNEEGANVMPTLIRNENPYTANSYSDIGLFDKQRIKELEAGGFDSAMYSQPDGAQNYIEYVSPAPNIRSRFAAFNPASRDSADLLASYLMPAATTGLLGYGLLNNQDAYAR
jgi:hypothetical protein